MHDLLIEVLKSILVVTAVLWIPCVIIGAIQFIRFLTWEWKFWKTIRAVENEDDDEYEDDSEVIYR